MAAVWLPRLDAEFPPCASATPVPSGSDGVGASVSFDALVCFFHSVVKRRQSLLLPLFLCLVFLCLGFGCLVFLCLVLSGLVGFVASFFSSRVVLLTFFFLLYIFLMAQALDDLVEKDAKIAEVWCGCGCRSGFVFVCDLWV